MRQVPRHRSPTAVAVAVLALLCGTCPVFVPLGGTPGTAAASRAAGHQPRPSRHHVERPVIVPRSAWQAEGADSVPGARYAPKVKAVVVHHTSTPNGYDCATVPEILRGLYAGHAYGRHWDDIGYNFLVDSCGTIYEGRAGGAGRPVIGAHTKGFNEGTVGVAAIGTFTRGETVPAPALEAIARLAAWKLDPDGPDPRGSVTLVSTNDEARYPKGTSAVLPVIGGHRDGYPTDCPGAALYAELAGIGARVARLQKR
ncbi:peptidoglycan recognition protein [Streptomyces sp. LP05-1]|uniref:Peptidoglycan recognition protein n=1 Tax=Streptomyces pyxinae TaxID=2970734 RepID=A0ABT2CJB4_9ACTN|nr:peptidoglycan recognition protein [Streptomyces sp. LP05-1]MCS0637510.1 peptidoglycan recognition protein [Streptomyces sp. LP05-1]